MGMVGKGTVPVIRFPFHLHRHAMKPTDIVFNIQRFSIHDGPGIRTTVFLKGCSMNCFWCHNPEGQHPGPDLRYIAQRCIHCGQCVIACPNHAHELHNGLHVFLRERCELSGCCVETCYSGALEFEGRVMTVDQVMREVLADRVFYDASGGGVTLSGGEPALSKDFALEILRECKRERLHTAIETCGEAPWTSLEALLPFTDLFMMDLKQLSPDKHRSATGHANDRILANAQTLAQTDKPLIFRTPVVPTVNDTDEEIANIASFVRELVELRRKRRISMNGSTGIQYELLPFHKMAADKYAGLGKEYRAADLTPPGKEKMKQLAETAKRHGVDVVRS